MTKARDIADFKFENIVDTGTEGTRVASGTTAQRGSTAGQLRFNSETGLAEYYTGTAFKSIDAPPTVTSIDDTEVDSQAGGNQTIVITGNGFNSGATVTFVGASGTDFNASTVTVDSDTQITAVAPKASFLNAQEPYGVKVTNVSGLSNTLASQINVDNAPTFDVASGTLGTLLNANRASSGITTVTATDADGDTITFSKISGTLPTGITFNSDGTFSGTANAETSDTTYTFTIRATAGGKTSDRQYTITVEAPAVITYNYTGSNQTFTVPSGVSSFQVYMWGAGGGGASSDNSSVRISGDGGAGGYVAGTLSNYSAGQTFSILVGQGDNASAGNTAVMNYGGGGAGTDNNNSQGPGGHGGGRSEISIGGGSNTPAGTRILVAGGGGGGGSFYHNGDLAGDNTGGNGAYPNGENGAGTGTVPTGGTQSAGGTAGSGASNPSWYTYAPTNGSAGIGGYGTSAIIQQDIGYGRPGGGGGGYYGGGGGDGGNGPSTSTRSQGGGGGSSYYNSYYISNFAHETGNDTTAPQASNTYYSSGIAVGGTGDNDNNRSTGVGGNGKVVIVY
jgi:hypothetical protein